MPMQPNPRADTSRLLLPSLRFCIVAPLLGQRSIALIRLDLRNRRASVRSAYAESGDNASAASQHARRKGPCRESWSAALLLRGSEHLDPIGVWLYKLCNFE